MFGSIFDKVTGLFDRRFVLGLLMPTLAFCAGVGALAATRRGWSQAASWWQHMDASRQVTLAVAVAGGLVFAATVLGTQVVAMTRVLEGYWRWKWVNKTVGELGRRREHKRAARLAEDATPMGYLRRYQAYAPEEHEVLPTRLGNALRAAEAYSGDGQRWGLDSAFWWPRLYLILPDSARNQVDEARASMDQMVLLSILSAVFGAVALGFAVGGLLTVGLGCAVGALVLSRLTYLAAVASAVSFGNLVRSCFDLFRGDLIAHLGWQMPDSLPNERKLWIALGQQLYRRGVDSTAQNLIDAPRTPPTPPVTKQS